MSRQVHVLEAGTIKRVHVNRHILAQNLKYNTNDPAITIQTSEGPITASHAKFLTGMPRMRQAGIDGAKPLSCGARVWVETKGKIQYW